MLPEIEKIGRAEDEDLDHDLFIEAEKILQLNQDCFRDTDGTFQEKYCKFVLIPEGIIYYLIRRFKMSAEKAQKYYLEFKNTETVVKDNEVEPEQPENYNNRNMFNNIELKREHDPEDDIPDLSDFSDIEEIS